MPKPWDGITEFLPDTLKTLVEPELERVFNEYDEKLSKYEAYDEYVDKYQPEQIANAVAYTQALEADPQRVFKDLSKFLEDRGVKPTEVLGIQEQAVAAAQDAADANKDPNTAYFAEFQKKFDELSGNFEKLAKYTVDRDQFNEAENQRKAIEAALDDLEEANKEKGFDRDYVRREVAAGATPDQAVKSFQDLLARHGGGVKKTEVPTFLGSGSLPSNQRPITELSEDELTQLSVQFIESQKAAAG